MKPPFASNRTVGLVAWLIAAVVMVGCSSDSDDPAATATATPDVTPTSPATADPTATVEPSVTATAVPTATPGPPRLERFAAGEVIDVAPAVVFVDPGTGAAEAWVTPGAFPEVAVAPDGSYVVYQVEEGFRLLRTADGSDREIRVDSLPIELGPGGTGFVATTQDHFVVSGFDGWGEHLGELWLGGLAQPRGVSWSADGELIAYALVPGGGPATTVSITSVGDWSSITVDVGPASGGASVEWSGDSQRLAVVTDDAVRVFDRSGELLGSYEGAFEGSAGNPRWAPGDSHLFVDRMPVLGGEEAYLFDADAEPLLRFFTPSYAGGCDGEVWGNETTIEFGDYDVHVDGTFELPDRLRGEIWSTDRLGVVLAEGIAFHLPHSGLRDGSGELEGGRLAFNTITWGGGHGGCGEAWSGSRETDSVVEWPPYSARP